MNGRVSSAGDLGYTYGTGTVVRQEAGDATHEMSYTRVWRRTPDREWHLVLEVVLPYPPAGTGG